MDANRQKASAEQELQHVLYKACSFIDQLSDAPEYRHVLLALFFLKRISDEWDSQRDARMTEEEAAVTHPALPYQLPPTSRFEYLYKHRHETGNSQRLLEALRGLERANLSLFSEMFDDICVCTTRIATSGDSDTALKALLELFATPDFDLSSERFPESGVIGRAFTLLLELMVSRQGKSTDIHFTPTALADLVARLVDPQDTETIFDPFSSAGSLLLRCAEHAQDKSEGAGQYALFGQEKNHVAWTLSKISLFLNNQLNHRILLGDSIRSPQLLDSKGKLRRFDVVVSQAPFSATNWGYEIAKDDPYGRFTYGVPPRSRGDFAFIQHMLASLDQNHGRLATIVPHGVLYRGGADAEIRQRLIEDNRLDAVIVLPERLLPNSGIPVAVLVFRSNKADNKVLFIDASKECQAGRRQNQLTDTNITNIVALFQKRESNEIDAHLASFEEIKQNDFNCSIQRYVRPPTDNELVDIPVLKQQGRALVQELIELNHSIEAALDELGFETTGSMQ